MTHYEAVFRDGTIARFEADDMDTEDGLVVFITRNPAGDERPVCIIGGAELLLVRDLTLEVELDDLGGAQWDEEDFEDFLIGDDDDVSDDNDEE